MSTWEIALMYVVKAFLGGTSTELLPGQVSLRF